MFKFLTSLFSFKNRKCITDKCEGLVSITGIDKSDIFDKM